MENVELIFEFNGEKIKIQGNRDDYMKDLINKFLNKVNLDLTNILFLYNGDILNMEKTLKEINNEDKIISIVVNKNDNDNEEKEYSPKYINCPTCNDNFFMEISDYNIKTKCKSCGIKENISLNEFKESIMNKEHYTQCQNCKEKKLNSKIYECLDCQIPICILCNHKHDSNHKSIEYEFKNNYCNMHKEAYLTYCKKCEKNLCGSCSIKHDKTHELIYLKDLLDDNNNLNDYLKEIRNNFDKIKEYIDKLKEILNGFEIYYYLYEILAKNYNKEHTSYQNIMNIISFNKYYKEIISDIFIKQKDFDIYLNNIYQKIRKENSNDVDDKNIIDKSNKSNEEMINIQEKGNEIGRLNNYIKDFSEYCLNNLDSLIITNFKESLSLKNWINPNSNIKVNLLYRLSRDGPEVSTFHNLCDNKGPTLTLFHLENDKKIGFYINESFDPTYSWKYDTNCFIFNLNQNRKFKKIKRMYLFDYPSFCCLSNCGPSVNGLGCNENNSLNYIFHSYENISKCFENGSEFLPNKSGETKYEVKEAEIFQILIE